MPESEKFREALKTAVDQDLSVGYETAYNKLRELTRSIVATVSEQPEKAQAIIEPGYRVNIGQQLRVVIRFPAKGYEMTLFRAYIPTDGFPVSFDFFGDEMALAQDEGAMEQTVLTFFTRPELVSQIRSWRELAEE